MKKYEEKEVLIIILSALEERKDSCKTSLEMVDKIDYCKNYVKKKLCGGEYKDCEI